jgi:hypothetical protein
VSFPRQVDEIASKLAKKDDQTISTPISVCGERPTLPFQKCSGGLGLFWIDFRSAELLDHTIDTQLIALAPTIINRIGVADVR